LQSGSYDFGIHFIPNVKDLETTLGSSPARPGFTTNVTVTVLIMLEQSINQTLQLNLKNQMVLMYCRVLLHQHLLSMIL
jgi:phage baseplate assembly protein W